MLLRESQLVPMGAQEPEGSCSDGDQVKSYQPWSGAPLHHDGAGVLGAVHIDQGVLLSVNVAAAWPGSAI